MYIVEVTMLQLTHDKSMPTKAAFFNYAFSGSNRKYEFLSNEQLTIHDLVICDTNFGLKFGRVYSCKEITDDANLPTQNIICSMGNVNKIHNDYLSLNRYRNKLNNKSKNISDIKEILEAIVNEVRETNSDDITIEFHIKR